MNILIFTLGTLVGSFLNVCIYRIPKKESIAYPPSHCTSCGTKLKPIDLIPIVSYIFCKGKCKYCGEQVSLQYPIIELLTGLIFLLFLTKFGLSMDFLFYIILFSILIVISGIDYHHQIIPDILVLITFVLGIGLKLTLFSIDGQAIDIINSSLGLLIGGGFLLLVAIVSRGGMGGGDIKLMAALGFWIGWKYTILALLLSFLIGGILSLGLLITKVKSRGEFIPFGPFLVIGFMMTALWGERILNWYFSKLL